MYVCVETCWTGSIHYKVGEPWRGAGDPPQWFYDPEVKDDLTDMPRSDVLKLYKQMGLKSWCRKREVMISHIRMVRAESPEYNSVPEEDTLLEEYTVAQLRTVLRNKGIAQGGTKDVLIGRIRDFLSEVT